MATIAIHHSAGGLDWAKTAPGTGLKQAFSGAVKNTGLLKNALKSLKTQMNNIKSVADVDTSSKKAAAAEERETKKQSALSVAYNKIEEYMQKVEGVDLAAAKEIRRLKGNFYSNYSYLKPENEKSTMERLGDGWNNFWGGFKDFIVGIGTAVKDFFVGIYEWCKEHIVAVVVALVVVTVAVVAACFLGPAAVIAVCSAIAFFCSIADLAAVAVTGKDVSTLLRESGHPIWADIFSGIEIGSTAAAAILSVASLAGQISKVGLNHFLTGGEKGFFNIMKYHAKNIIGGFKDDFTAVFGKNLSGGQRVKAVWNIVVLNQSGDFSFKESISAFRSGQHVIRLGKDNPYVEIDANGNYIPKGELKQSLGEHGFDTDVVHVKKYGNTVDYDWSYYARTAENPMGNPAGYSNFSDLYKNNSSELLQKFDGGALKGTDVRPMVWKDAKGTDGIKVRAMDGMTRHEAFNLKSGVVSIYQVPTDVHGMLRHNGGISQITNLWNQTLNNSLFREETQRFVRGGLESLLDQGGQWFFSWAHAGE